jgi:ppGpp synthetase/RelA/SpoT-type nucleotidyltranferase
LHGSNDVKALRAAAEENKPELEARLKEIAGEVPGIHFVKSRVKDLSGLEEKIAQRGRSPNTISDYLGAQVDADTPQALYSFVDRMRDTGAIVEGEEFIATPKLGGYRAVHLQIGLGDGTSAELQILPKPIAEVKEEAHAIRQPVKRIFDKKNRTAEEAALADATMRKAQAIMDNAWAKAPEWSGQAALIKEPGAARAGVPQEEPGELFGQRPEKLPDMFFDAGGQPQSFERAMGELDQFKIAADQIAACAAPAAEAGA